MARLPASIPDSRRTIRPASQSRTGRRLARDRRPRPHREDPLLLLRPAVRHPAQGEGRQDRRLRAVGGVPVQQGEALPQGREALHAGRASGSPADAARPRRGARLPADRLGHGARSNGARDPAHPGRVRPRRLRGADRRVADEREGLPDGQVRARGRAHGQHRLQRPALHGVGGRRVEEDSRHRPQRQPVERHPARRR